MEELKLMGIITSLVVIVVFIGCQGVLIDERAKDKAYCLQRLELTPSTETFCNKLLENYYGD